MKGRTMPSRDFYATSAPAPLDQADGLRRLFAPSRTRFIPLAANPHVPHAGPLLDHVALTLVARGQRVLVVDAADGAPQPNEMTVLDVGAGIETLTPQLGYLAAKGLPLAFVDTRGSAGGLLDAIVQAAPKADVVLLHANASDLARMFMHRAARPVLVAADHEESVKHAYAACKLLAQRCSLMTFDLLLCATRGSGRMPSIAASLAGCADGFLGAVLHDWAVLNPLNPPDEPDVALDRLLAAQLALGDERPHPGLPRQPAVHLGLN
ncbi:MAG: MinD/ParA family protein [Rubrivivax sp.]|jgi:flagellar biosynthesis protein FlhG